MAEEAQEQVSNEESVSETTEAPKEETPNYVTQEDLKTALAEARESGRREGQSTKDREIQGVRREYESGQRAGFETLDEETRDKVELAQLRNQERQRVASQQQVEIDDATQEVLNVRLKAFNIDPKDSRIDYALDVKGSTPDVRVRGEQRFNDSLARIVKEDAVKVAETEKVTMKKDFDAMEQKLRVDLGLETVDTSTGAGVDTSDGQFEKDWASGKLPATKENKEKAKKLYGG